MGLHRLYKTVVSNPSGECQQKTRGRLLEGSQSDYRATFLILVIVGSSPRPLPRKLSVVCDLRSGTERSEIIVGNA
jgi:hypothetical protein